MAINHAYWKIESTARPHRALAPRAAPVPAAGWVSPQGRQVLGNEQPGGGFNLK